LKIIFISEGFRKSTLKLQPWRRIKEVSSKINQGSINVTIFSDRAENESESEDICGVYVKRFENVMWSPLFKRQKLLNEIAKEKADVVFWHGSPLSALYLSRLKSIGVPLVWDIDVDITNLRSLRCLSLRELFSPHHFFLWQKFLIALFPKELLKNVGNSFFISKIIVPNATLKNKLSEIGINANKIIIISSAIEKSNLTPLPLKSDLANFKQELGFQSDDFILTYFGSPCTLRGTDTAILAIRRILEIDEEIKKNIKLVILSRRKKVGINSDNSDVLLEKEEQYLNTLVRKNDLSHNVVIVSGYLEKEIMNKYLFASDVIALPFKIVLSEPPLSILEAMYLQKLVITTSTGSLPEIIGGKRGLLCEPGDPESLAKKILSIINKPKIIADLEVNGKTFAEAMPSWEDISKRYLELINQIITEV
jgi:phosphatidyl-myo-inositol dimannoside synthase